MIRRFAISTKTPSFDMGLIAPALAGLSVLLLLNTPHQTMMGVVLACGLAAWSARRVASPPDARHNVPGEDGRRFWQHAAVISFWTSVIVSSVGIYMALQ